MGASCSSGMPSNIGAANPLRVEVQKALHEMIPPMLEYLVSGKKKDFDSTIKAHCVDTNVLFVLGHGQATRVNALEIDTSKEYKFSKAVMTDITSIRVFAGELAAVATVIVSCSYDLPCGVYEIQEDTFSMRTSAMQQPFERVNELDKGQKVTIDHIVAVGDRLRGRIKGKSSEWITLVQKGNDVAYTKLIRESNSKDDRSKAQSIYTIVLEKVEETEGEFVWKLAHVTISSN